MPHVSRPFNAVRLQLHALRLQSRQLPAHASDARADQRGLLTSLTEKLIAMQSRSCRGIGFVLTDLRQLRALCRNRGKFPGKQVQHFPLAVARLNNINRLRGRRKFAPACFVVCPGICPGYDKGPATVEDQSGRFERLTSSFAATRRAPARCLRWPGGFICPTLRLDRRVPSEVARVASLLSSPGTDVADGRTIFEDAGPCASLE